MPPWIEECREYLVGSASCDEWTEAISLWHRFESETASEDSNARLGAASFRPAPLSKWFVSRSYDASCMPEIEDAGAFGKEWTRWWNEMQPKSRRSAGEGELPLELTPNMTAGIIQALKKNGPAGISVVLVGLKWWGPEIMGRQAAWINAVKDVTACLRLFVTA